MISTELLNDVANYVNGKIAKVVLNDSYEITDFDLKQVDTDTINLQFTVPNGAVAAITGIELRENPDTVISSNTVYVPITTDTIITQTIEVKEG